MKRKELERTIRAPHAVLGVEEVLAIGRGLLVRGAVEPHRLLGRR